VEVEALDAEKHLQAVPEAQHYKFKEGMHAARVKMEKALHEWGDSVAKYRDAKKAQWPNRAEVLMACKTKIAEYEVRLQEARSEWQLFLKTLRQGVSAGA